MFYRIQEDIENLFQKGAFWHKDCYSAYTSKSNLASRKIDASLADSPNNVCLQQGSQSHTRTSTRHIAHFNTSLCMFCQSVKRGGGTKKLSEVNTKEGAQTLHGITKVRHDEIFLRINDVDLMAVKAKYHQTCRANYVNMKSPKCQMSSPTYIKSSFEEALEAAFTKVASEVESSLLVGHSVKEVGLLCQKINQILKDDGFPRNSCTNKTVKTMLVKHFGHKISFTGQHDRTKSQLVYSSDVDLGEVVTTLKHVNDSHDDSMFGESFESRGDDEDALACGTAVDKDLVVLMKAARILRTELTHAKGLETWPPVPDDICQARAEQMIREKIRMFLRWILVGDEATDCEDPSETEKATDLRILAIGQDLLFASSKGHNMTPKHVALANAIHHTARSKYLLTMVNRFGHCISRDQMLRINTAVADQLLSASGDIFIPAGVQPNVFTQIAADNNDLLEETVDGKNTTHCTSMIIIQRPGEGPVVTEPFGAFPVSSRRPRALRNTAMTVLKKHTRLPKRINPMDIVFDPEDVKPLSDFSWSSELDAVWQLSRVIPQKLFTLEYDQGCSSDQCVPGWTAFNSMVSPNSQIMTPSVISYCPVINAAPTSYDAVYTLMDTACRITRKIGQQHTVLVLDQAIYCKALEIAHDKSEEFQNLVLRMGGFHILTAFLAVVGKRMEDSGFEDIFIESGVFAEGSVPAIMSGKAYNRAVRAHKLMSEGLRRLLGEMVDIEESDKGLIRELVAKVREDFSSKSADVSNSVSRLQQYIPRFIAEIDDLRTNGSQRSTMFHFWSEYLSMIDILLSFIKAERTGEWNLHKSSLSLVAMLPYFFA